MRVGKPEAYEDASPYEYLKDIEGEMNDMNTGPPDGSRSGDADVIEQRPPTQLTQARTRNGLGLEPGGTYDQGIGRGKLRDAASGGQPPYGKMQMQGNQALEISDAIPRQPDTAPGGPLHTEALNKSTVENHPPGTSFELGGYHWLKDQRGNVVPVGKAAPLQSQEMNQNNNQMMQNMRGPASQTPALDKLRSHFWPQHLRSDAGGEPNMKLAGDVVDKSGQFGNLQDMNLMMRQISKDTGVRRPSWQPMPADIIKLPIVKKG